MMSFLCENKRFIRSSKVDFPTPMLPSMEMIFALMCLNCCGPITSSVATNIPLHISADMHCIVWSLHEKISLYRNICDSVYRSCRLRNNSANNKVGQAVA